ncbi:MAG: glycosyltransferase [Clostridium sp.]|nr:glycosyltransferase [Clostridium sp.]
MKVLVVHNFHRTGSASGDDQVFKSETMLLQQHGIDVVRYTVSNDSFDSLGILGKLVATFEMLWSFKNYKTIKKIIKEQHPDVCHIHTFFPLLSPSVLYVAKRHGCKVIATLHDTRFICPCATSLRGTEICNKCGDGNYLRMCKYKCFKGSRLQSLLVAIIFKYHRVRKSFYKQIDKYICLNENQITLLKNIGFNEEKIVKKYNFVHDPKAESKEFYIDKELPNRYVVFYGRIGEEKGIRVLMDIWNKIDDIPLVVMGAGPMEEEFKKWANKKKNVYFLGYTQHEKCLSIVKNGEFVVFPSIWYEGCSMVEIETESLGKAIVATDLGFSSEAIKDGINGYKVKLGNVEGFVRIIKELWKSPELCTKIGENARIDYESKYLPEDNYNQLINIYNDTLIK